MSTYDDHLDLIVPYTEPVKSTRRTTFDLVTARHTVEAIPNAIGDTQTYAGRQYIFNGIEWKILEPHEEF